LGNPFYVSLIEQPDECAGIQIAPACHLLSHTRNISAFPGGAFLFPPALFLVAMDKYVKQHQLRLGVVQSAQHCDVFIVGLESREFLVVSFSLEGKIIVDSEPGADIAVSRYSIKNAGDCPCSKLLYSMLDEVAIHSEWSPPHACVREVYPDNFPRLRVNMTLDNVTIWISGCVNKFRKIFVWRVRLHFKDEAL